MADPLTPEEMAELQQRARWRAEQAALGGQSVPPPATFAPPPAPAPAAPPAAPAEAPPADPGFLQGSPIARAAGDVGAALLGPPVAAYRGLVQNRAHDTAKLKERPGAEPAPTEPAGPPKPEPPADTSITGEEIPFAPGALGGGVRTGTPAGMYPDAREVSVHQGREVPVTAKTASLAATEFSNRAAEAEHAAGQQYYAAAVDAAAEKARIAEDAAAQHRRVMADRAALVEQKVAATKDMNAAYNAKVDPNAHWSKRDAFGRVAAGIAMGLGAMGSALTGTANHAMIAIQNGINEEIDAQKANNEMGIRKAERKMTLLDHNIAAQGDRDKGIEATKMALWDSVAAQLEKYAAMRNLGQEDAKLNQMRAAIAEKRAENDNRFGLQEQDDVNKKETAKYHMASGGVGAITPNKEVDHIITIPASDGTKERATAITVPSENFKTASDMQAATNGVVQMNADAIKARDRLRAALAAKDLTAIQNERKTLKDLTVQRARLAQKVQDPGSVVRDSELAQELATSIDYTAGILGHSTAGSGDVEKLIRRNSNQAQKITDAKLRGLGARVVQPMKQRATDGSIRIRNFETGQLYNGRSVAPEQD